MSKLMSVQVSYNHRFERGRVYSFPQIKYKRGVRLRGTFVGVSTLNPHPNIPSP